MEEAVIPASWTEWSPYSSCVGNCEKGGWANRTRTCTAPPPSSHVEAEASAVYCQGEAEESKLCEPEGCRSESVLSSLLLTAHEIQSIRAVRCKLISTQAIYSRFGYVCLSPASSSRPRQLWSWNMDIMVACIALARRREGSLICGLCLDIKWWGSCTKCLSLSLLWKLLTIRIALPTCIHSHVYYIYICIYVWIHGIVCSPWWFVQSHGRLGFRHYFKDSRTHAHARTHTDTHTTVCHITQWSQWSECSTLEPCQQGWRTRERTITNVPTVPELCGPTIENRTCQFIGPCSTLYYIAPEILLSLPSFLYVLCKLTAFHIQYFSLT